ncbi:MAG: bis(5'-nucleosyl)-tetraphosphatase (symmetrical) YqeK [Peptoniphilus sp.]|nr:bis(5'-nucleosyl)-tetraphosphatase (symmetrical) YqeK [Peptoniphilus sp.]MDD7363692.1 bis(5'-nucleosyl)-tetraphosphatase (symmetrical) YqeK [Bacillota bacterium]MDY6044077.1 bis(5'-nucleosyl)-tetraphosphatase (symmetrical) YqeK [Peptoniphilus sp.]
MKKPDFDKIVDLIGEKRYKHILRVVDTAADLANRHGVDVEKAETAALFHDIYKYKDEALLWDEAKRLGVESLEKFEAFPQILHAYVAAESARVDYGIDDEEILDAIRYHTTGIDHMSKVAEVVFLADYLEPMRNFDGVEALREEAKRDLTGGMRASICQNLQYLVESKHPIFLDTVRCYNDYIGRR